MTTQRTGEASIENEFEDDISLPRSPTVSILHILP